MVRLVCELGMQLQMRQYDCNGAAGRTFCAAVIVVCLVRYAMSAMRFFGTYSVCFYVIVLLDCCKRLFV